MKNSHIFLLAGLLIIMNSCFEDDSYSIVLRPNSIQGKDAFVEDYPYNDYRNQNFGNSEEFAAISGTSGSTQFIVRSFIDFDFDTIPANAFIESAKLSLFAYGNDGHGMGHYIASGSNECYLQRVIQDWEENLITWNSQPMTTELNQVLISQSESTMQDYVAIDITSLVRDILNNIDESHGFMLRLRYENGYRRMFFATSDVIEESKRPTIEIYYKLSNK